MRRPNMQVIGTILWMLFQVSSSLLTLREFRYHPSGFKTGISEYLSDDAQALVRTNRSVTCNNEMVINFIKRAGETCTNIKNVDDYITNLNLKQTITVPSSNDKHGFKNIVTQYNNDLQNAKENCKPWRNGDSSIYGSVTQMVAVAKEFEPKFNREFEQNQARVKNIIDNHEDIRTVEAKITALQEEIREAQEAIKVASVSTVKTHLEELIESKEEEIKTTKQYHQVLQANRELGELIKYLEFVRSDSAQIATKAENARSKISQFRDNVANDAGAFKRIRNMAKESITKLGQEKENNNRELANIQNERDNLNKKIAEERAQINSLNHQIARARTELQNTERDISRSERKAKKRKRIGGFLTVLVPVVGWVAGPAMSRSAKRRLRDLANQKRAVIHEHSKQVQNLQSQITNSNRDIAQFHSRISTYVTRKGQIESELSHFNELDGKLESVEGEATSILPKITSAISGIDSMRNTFDAIKRNLDNTIENAKVSKTAAEVRNIKHFIYNEIDQLKCKWNEANEKIILVGMCK